MILFLIMIVCCVDANQKNIKLWIKKIESRIFKLEIMFKNIEKRLPPSEQIFTKVPQYDWIGTDNMFYFVDPVQFTKNAEKLLLILSGCGVNKTTFF